MNTRMNTHELNPAQLEAGAEDSPLPWIRFPRRKTYRLILRMEQVSCKPTYQWNQLHSVASRVSYQSVNPGGALHPEPSRDRHQSSFTNEHVTRNATIRCSQPNSLKAITDVNGGLSNSSGQRYQNGCNHRLPGLETKDIAPANDIGIDHHSAPMHASSSPLPSVSRLVMCNVRYLKDRCQSDCSNGSTFDESLINTVEVPDVPVMNSSSPRQCDGQVAARKREIYLSKNREAARICRLKKKEYISCLETRVNVLEVQNRVLLEELRSLKELFHYQKDL